MATSPPHDCWSLLVVKARQGLSAAQQQKIQAEAKLAQIRAGENRLQVLMAEYRERQQQTQAKGRLMADNLNEQRFIAQLQRLLDQATRAAQAAAHHCADRAEAVVRAQRELDKAEKLEAHARAAEAVLRERAQQKAQDEWATLRFQRQGA